MVQLMSQHGILLRQLLGVELVPEHAFRLLGSMRSVTQYRKGS